jgi:hypothetical protein
LVLIQIGAINGVSEALAVYLYGADCDFAICDLDCAERFFEKPSVPTVRLHAPRSDEDALSHDYNPDADKAVLAGASPNAQTFALPEGSQGVIGESSLRSHVRTRLAD